MRFYRKGSFMEAVKSQKSVLDVMSEWSRLLTQFHDDTEEVYSLLASPLFWVRHFLSWKIQQS